MFTQVIGFFRFILRQNTLELYDIAMTEWTTLPQIRQMDATIRIGEIGNTELINSKIKVGKHMWSINFNIGGRSALIQSLYDFHIPSDSHDPQYNQAVRELERAVAYMRSAVTFAFETPTKRGFESFVGELGDFFPSERDARAYKRSTENLAIATQVLEDIGRKYSRNVHRLLEYWRRGFELGEMWYFSEAYLNYYKILELMAKQVHTGTNVTYAELKHRFNTATKFKQRYGFTECDIVFAAKVFAFWGNRRVTIPMFKTICRIAKVRNNFNVGHTQPTGSRVFYSAVGQFSDDFDLTQIEGIFLMEIARLLILHSLGFNKYWLDGSNGPYVLKILESS